MHKIIITGPNGAGKSHAARRLNRARPDLPVISFDGIKLTTEWAQRPRTEIDAALEDVLQRPAWILEGGPSLLSRALPHADALIWLDPPEYLRAWRLFIRPLKGIGKTRPELPNGNADWPLQQYRFAVKSLQKRAGFAAQISNFFDPDTHAHWRCRNERDLNAAISACAEQIR